MPTILRENAERREEVFDIQHYKTIRRYLSFVGQNPYQSNGVRSVLTVFTALTVLSIFVPTSFEIIVSLRGRDMDAVIECLPHLIATATCVVKIINVYLNRENFAELFAHVAKEWQRLRWTDEFDVLDGITLKGSKIAELYRNTLLCCLTIFTLGPLIIPLLDVIVPLNETRPRQQALRVNYLIFDADRHFFYVYLHLTWGAVIVVVTIVTVDSMYILIIHHSSALFAVCGHCVKRTTERDDILLNTRSEGNVHEELKKCLTMHDNAIQFYNTLNESSRNSYLIQVGLNMIGISVTAVQTVLNLDRPEEAIRTALFLGAEQFHLFVISLPGQVLIDHCTQFRDDIYSSKWYRVPVNVQRMIHTMQIRSQTLCTLTAGGLYEMNMENFATTFKTCMSYFTMLMSLRE